MQVQLPWMPKELSPNSRVHYMKAAKIKSQYKLACFGFSKAALQPFQGNVLLSITFHPPDKRKRDLDNMLAALKAGLDGLSEAIGVNDYNFAITIRRGEPVQYGAVNIKVCPDEFAQ